MYDKIPRALAERIRLVVLDVDGVLTDGGIYMGRTAAGETVEYKRFEITDQLGIKLLQWAGFEVVFVSGRVSGASQARAAELGCACYEGPGGHKLAIVERLQTEQGVGWEETACICDDLADVPILARAALPVAVANAVPEVRAVARWQTRRGGGHGAVRELAEALLRARGEYPQRITDYVRERGGVG
jgi:3-deoxy-D-manno-octulosonate 8-phosphate phosphatase (KDO 8-P phosphatase)